MIEEEKRIAKNKANLKYYYKNKEKISDYMKVYQKEYYLKNKEELNRKSREKFKVYMSKEENKVKRRAYMKAYRLKNLKKHRAYDRKYIKKPEQRARRTQNLRDWRKKNPRKSTNYSMMWYFKNQAKADATHKIWNDKKKAEIGSSLWKHYGMKIHSPVMSALSRAFGIKTSLNGQQIKTIKGDIQILKREITKQREILNKWK